MAFSIPEFMLRLQWLQDQHDQHYHQDIYTMSRTNNITHMVMHMAKYVGKLVTIEELGPTSDYSTDPTRLHGEYAGVLTDVLIVMMSAANRMNINLGNELSNLCKGSDVWAVYHGFYPNNEAAVELIRAAMVLPEELQEVRVLNQITPLIRGMGMMSKALEALDHMESYPSRAVLNDQIVLMFMHALRLYHFYSLTPFIAAIEARMVQIERASFMYNRRPKYSEGFIPVEA